jgi:nitrate reductase assembly molybdenum cofactor insertion protein NarJ
VTERLLGTLAPLFRYPDADYPQHLAAARLRIRDRDFDAFAGEMAELDLRDQQMTYTSTFDVAPSCSPYLGTHLFGEDMRDRARLMIGLRNAYGARAISPAAELPDHIAEVIDFADRYGEEEWGDLRRLVLLPALSRMEETLSATANPYRHLVAATRRLTEGNGS